MSWLGVMNRGALILCAVAWVSCKKPAPTEQTRRAQEPADFSKSRQHTEIKPFSQKGRILPRPWDSVGEVRSACDSRLKRADSIKQQILAVKGSRDQKNTLRPLNLLLIQLDRLQPLSELIANVHPKKPVRGEAEKCERRAKKYLSELKLHRGLYQALKAVQTRGLDTRARRFVKHLLRDYRRAGVDRDPATRKKLAALDARRVKLEQEFQRNIREDKRFIEVTEQQLAGLPADWVAARRKKKTASGKIKVTTDYPDFFPLESYARSEAVRKRLYHAYLSRAFPVNQRVFQQLLQTRHDYATTLGYSDWAEYMAEDKMVKRKKVVADFIERVANLARPRMVSDLQDILRRKKKDVPTAQGVGSWDRFYYVKRIQAERFGVKPDEVRAYFEFGRVKKGLLTLAQELFGVTFRRVRARVWHPSVETYDVYNQGKRVARFFLDLHPRRGKYGHAAEFPIYTGIPGIQLPAAALVTNFPNPATTGGTPALTEHTQVTTFFHEFGHLMHQLLAGRQPWVTQSGITCEWDFVEAPSQLLEEWSWDPKVLARFARHHQTGKPIPARLVQRMRQASEFGKGVHVMRQMYYAALSYAYHSRDPKKLNLMAVIQEIQRKYSPYPYQPGTAPFANFGHLAGYSSMYYTYMWSLVLAKDMLTRFKKHGLMHRATALAYRQAVIEPGGSVDAVDMVERFLGRPYSFAAFQKWLQQK